MRVRINAHGSEVDVEASDVNIKYEDVMKVALATWRSTMDPPYEKGGLAYGFSNERQPPAKGYKERYMGKGSNEPYIEAGTRPVVEG